MEGRCYCGEIHYEVTQVPVVKGQCHCRECQYITGGGPNYFMAVPEGGFVVTRGTPKTFTRTDLDAPRTRQFCGTCGTHLTSLLAGRPVVILKVGTLDAPGDAYGGPEVAIFMKDAQPFHMVAEGVTCFQDMLVLPAK